MIETTFNGFFIWYYCNSINILNIATIVNIIVNILKSFLKKNVYCQRHTGLIALYFVPSVGVELVSSSDRVTS